MLPGFMLIRSDPEPIVGMLFFPLSVPIPSRLHAYRNVPEPIVEERFFPPFAPMLSGFMLVGMILS